MSTRKIALSPEQRLRMNLILHLKDKGMSNVKIGKEIGISESSVRRWLRVRNLMAKELLAAVTEIVQEAREKIETQIGFLDELHYLYGEGTTIKMVPVQGPDGNRHHYAGSFGYEAQRITYELNIVFDITPPEED